MKAFVIYSQSTTYFNRYLSGQDPPYSCRGFTEDLNGNIYGLSYTYNYFFKPKNRDHRRMEALHGMIGLSICTDASGNIWFGGEDAKVFRYVPSLLRFATGTYPLEKSLATWSIIPMRNGQIWAGTTKGLWIIDPESDAPLKPLDLLNGDTILRQSTIYHMLETPEGVWLSTDNGLFLADPVIGIKKTYQRKEFRSAQQQPVVFSILIPKGFSGWPREWWGLIRWDRHHQCI